MRYVRQLDDYSCGPIAILNAMKWAGLDVSVKSHLPFLQFGCRTIDLENPHDYENNGTYDHDFDRVIRYVAKGSFRVRKTSRPTLPKIRAHLESGGTIAFCYYWKDGKKDGEHFAFLAGIQNGRFLVVNDHYAEDHGTVTLRTEATLRKWLRKNKENPICWFLSKFPDTHCP